MKRRYRPRFNVERIAEDMALRGWNMGNLAHAADVHLNTIRRFLSGEYQTPKTAERIARALGYPLKRYFAGVETLV